jgi:hypothetical protein
MYANFLLGELHVSDVARITLKRIPLDLIARHAVNEHGQITARERANNQQAMRDLGEIRSRYMIDPTNPRLGSVLVVTCETWSDTRVTLESET